MKTDVQYNCATGVCNEQECVLCEERTGASVINSYQSLAFYERRTGSGIPRPLRDKNGETRYLPFHEKGIRNTKPRIS